MKRYVIERDLPGIGNLNREQLKDAAATSNSALANLSGKAQWVQSFVVDDKTFCIYLADGEASVREHGARGRRRPRPCSGNGLSLRRVRRRADGAGSGFGRRTCRKLPSFLMRRRYCARHLPTN